MTGKVTTIFRDRGFGFVVDQGGVDWFFHLTVIGEAVFRQLRAFDQVEFEGETTNRKGPRVTKLSVVPV
jgi:cold shock CspA family protein